MVARASAASGEEQLLDRKETEIRAGSGPERAGGVGPSTRVDTAEPEASRFESLLRQGQSLFEAGSYERAIHVWTRVLFLERGHPEARQGIDRAKRALAEQQRRLDASVAEARLFVDEGKLDEAREVLRSVLLLDPRHVEARGLETELAERAPHREPALEPPAARPRPAGTSPKGVRVRTARSRAPRSDASSRASRVQMALFGAATTLAFAAAAFVLHENWERLVSGPALASQEAVAPAAALAPGSVEVLSLSELYYDNGVRLFEKARYREALRELSRVARDSPVASEARSLMLRIEERLLRGASTPENENGREELRP